MISRDQFISEIHKMKIGIGIHYRSISEQSVYKKNFGWKLIDYPNANKIGKETISISLSSALKHHEILRIIKAIKKIFQKVKK